MRVLCLTAGFPYPLDTGGQVRVAGQLRALAVRHDVLLLSGARSDTRPEHVDAFRTSLGVGAEVFPAFGPRGSLTTWARALRRGCPPYVASQLSDELGRRLVVAAASRDVVVALDDYAGAYFDLLPAGIPVVLDKHRVMAGQRLAPLPRSPGDVSERLLARFERHGVERAAVVIVTSEVELEKVVTRYRPARAISVPSEPPPLDVARAPDGRTVAWMGTHEYGPNRDGLERFLSNGWDEVGGDAALAIVGKGPGAALRSHVAGRDDLQVLGFVDDLASFMARPAAAVVPIWAGGGVKLKTVTFMEAGVPVVSTAGGLEGLNAQDGVHALRAETPEELAAGLRRLLADPLLAERIGKAGQRLVRERRDSGVGSNAFVEAVECAGGL